MACRTTATESYGGPAENLVASATGPPLISNPAYIRKVAKVLTAGFKKSLKVINSIVKKLYELWLANISNFICVIRVSLIAV